VRYATCWQKINCAVTSRPQNLPNGQTSVVACCIGFWTLVVWLKGRQSYGAKVALNEIKCAEIWRPMHHKKMTY
jgi:hypothetical protein